VSGAAALESQGHLAEIFLLLNQEERTGTLRVTDGVASTRYIYFQSGSIQHVRSFRARTLLGRALVKRRKLEEGELKRALQLHWQSGERVGACCLKLELCTREDIREALIFQAIEEVTDLFTWTRPVCSFHRGEPPLDIFDFDDLEVPLNLNTEAVLREATRRAGELVVLRRQVPSVSDIYTLSPEAFYSMRQQDEGSPEHELLRHLDGERDVEELLQVARMSELEALRALVRLIRGGEVVPLTPIQLVQAAAEVEREGKLEKAHRLYLRAEAGGLAQLDLPNRLAKLADALGRREEAVARYLEFAERCRAEELPEAAVAAYRKALELDPGSVQAMEDIVGALVELGKPQEAVGFLKQLVARCDPEQDRDKLQRVWQEVLRLEPEDRDAHRGLATLFIEAGDTVQGIMELEELAAIHIASGDLDGAVSVLREILDIDPRCVEAHLQLATTLAQMERTAESVAEYAKLAESLEKAGDDGEATNWSFLVEIYEKIVTLDPAHVKGRQWLADAYRGKAETDKAVRQYEGLVTALREEGTSEELAAALRQLAELQPDDYVVREELGLVLKAVGRREEARAVLSETCEQAQRQHRFDVARRTAEVLLEVDPLDLETHQLLHRVALIDKDQARAFSKACDAARLAVIARQDDVAIESARKALELRGDADMRELLAEALERVGETADAAKELVEAGRLHLSAEDFGRASRAGERAVMLSSGLPAAQDLLYMVETRRASGKAQGQPVVSEDELAEKPTITGGSSEVTIVDRPRRKHGSVAGVASKLKNLRNPFGGPAGGEATEQPVAASQGISKASARLKALMGGGALGGGGADDDGGWKKLDDAGLTAGGGARGEAGADPSAGDGWQKVESAAAAEAETAGGDPPPVSKPKRLSAAEKLKRMKLGGLGGGAAAAAPVAPDAQGGGRPDGEGSDAASQAPKGMQLAKGGKKAMTAAQKLRALKG
jgi:superkiller protein 3